MVDLFKILGLGKDATKEEIKKAYYALAKKYHPDHLSNDYKDSYINKFREITIAYKVLIDDKQRATYLRNVALGEFEMDTEKQRRESREKLLKEGKNLLRKDSRRAEKYFRMAYTLDKLNPLYISYYGLSLILIGKKNDGIALIEKSLNIGVKSLDVLLNCAEAYIEAGYVRPGKKYLKMAMKINKNNIRVNRIISRLKHRRNNGS